MAVATHNLAVGASVPFAWARVGAGVSQLETNPLHAGVVEAALRSGRGARDAVAEALRADDRFNDGAGPRLRQIAVVSASGGSAAHTGKEAGPWSGHRTGKLVVVAGNGLANRGVVDAMWRMFHATEGHLAQRLLAALEAGYQAGGQTIGVTSAALRVAHPRGWPLDVDLRADFAPGTALESLRRMYDGGRARILLNRARRALKNKDLVHARALTDEALRLAPSWDRIWRSAFFLGKDFGRPFRRKTACRFRALNPRWGRSLPPPFDGLPCHAK